MKSGDLVITRANSTYIKEFALYDPRSEELLCWQGSNVLFTYLGPHRSGIMSCYMRYDGLVCIAYCRNFMKLR